MKRIGHTAVYRGKRVIVFLRDGTKIRGKFQDRPKGFVILEGGHKIAKRDIRTISIDKGARYGSSG